MQLRKPMLSVVEWGAVMGIPCAVHTTGATHLSYLHPHPATELHDYMVCDNCTTSGTHTEMVL